MNYSNNIRYNILTAEIADFSVMVEELLENLPSNETILRLIFFGDSADNEEYVKRRAVLNEKVTRYFGANKPAFSYVAQPTLDCQLLVEVHSYLPEKNDSITYRFFGNVSYVILENEAGRFLYAGGFQGDVAGASIEEQSRDVFEQIGKVLEKEGFPINSIVRQWNYIERITAYEDGDQHYQSFNNARAAFYKKTDWASGYPAATGIGADRGGILVDFDAALLKREGDWITPIDNKLQVAAHEYSKNVLKNAADKKETPKFERAKSLTISGKPLVYISGTAAIRGEASLKDVGVEEQLRITMENISELTGETEPVMLRVYLKNKEDFAASEALLKQMVPELPVSYLLADVCRDELLIEIEGVSI